VDDTKISSSAEVTDHSCTVEFIETVPPDRPSDDYHTSQFIDPVVEVKPEDLQEMKHERTDENDNGNSHELADEYETEDTCLTVQVSCTCAFSTAMLWVDISLRTHLIWTAFSVILAIKHLLTLCVRSDVPVRDGTLPPYQNTSLVMRSVALTTQSRCVTVIYNLCITNLVTGTCPVYCC